MLGYIFSNNQFPTRGRSIIRQCFILDVVAALDPPLPTSMSIEEILDLPINLNFSPDKRCVHCIMPKNISNNFN